MVGEQLDEGVLVLLHDAAVQIGVEEVGEHEDAYIVVGGTEGQVVGMILVVAVQSFVRVVVTITGTKTSVVTVLGRGQVEAIQLVPVVTVIGGEQVDAVQVDPVVTVEGEGHVEAAQLDPVVTVEGGGHVDAVQL